MDFLLIFLSQRVIWRTTDSNMLDLSRDLANLSKPSAPHWNTAHICNVKAHGIPDAFLQQSSFDKAICSVKVIALIDSKSITSALYVYTYASICRIPDANWCKQFSVFWLRWAICHILDTLKEIFKKVFGLEVDKIMRGRKTKLHVLVLY